MIPYLLILFRF